MKYIHLGLLAALAALSGVPAHAQTSNARNLATLGAYVKFPLIPFSSGAFGNLTIAGVNAANNILIGTNGVEGAIETTCVGFWSCGSGGWTTFLGGTGYGGTGITGAENTAFGWLAMSQQTTGSFNVALGGSALGQDDIASDNVAVGEDAMRNTNSGGGVVRNQFNVALGESAIRNCKACTNDVAVGYFALHGPEGTQPYNTAPTNVFSVGVGANALAAANGVNSDIAIGYGALSAATTASSSICIGANGCANLTTGNNYVFIGHSVGQGSAPAAGDVGIGYQALKVASGDNRNVALGFSAGQTLTTAADNVFVGYQAGTLATTGGTVTSVGSLSGGALTTGADNTLLGYNAGHTLTTGSHNIIIGDQTTGLPAASSAVLAVRDGIRGSLQSVTAGGNLSSCGTSPTMTAASTEMAGTFTTGTGATACQLTFANQTLSTSHPPTCLVTARSGTAPVYTTFDNGTLSGLQLTTAAASATYDYWCPVH